MSSPLNAEPRARLLRLLSTIRLHEVIPLQGSPAVGAAMAASSIGAGDALRAALLIAASGCLVAHVFLFNDWAGIEGDRRHAARADTTFVARGVRRSAVGCLAAALAAAALLFAGLLGWTPFILCLALIVVSTLYSAPWTHWKASPVIGTLLHLPGGALHFLLGYCAFAPLDYRGVTNSAFFGLVFAAGHLMHETRDHDGDLANGIRTNAVVFGKRRSFAGGLMLFSAAYALLFALALFGLLPKVMLLAGAGFALHLHVSLQTWRDGLTDAGLRRLQGAYHRIVALLGVLLVASARF